MERIPLSFFHLLVLPMNFMASYTPSVFVLLNLASMLHMAIWASRLGCDSGLKNNVEVSSTPCHCGKQTVVEVLLLMRITAGQLELEDNLFPANF